MVPLTGIRYGVSLNHLLRFNILSICLKVNMGAPMLLSLGVKT